MIRNKATIGILLALALCHPQFAAAQKKDDSPASLADMVQSGGVDVQADELEYESDRRVMTGRGHVVIKHGVDTLTADFVTVDTVTQDATARGNVVIQREGTVWRGEEAKYNFKTRTGNFGGFDADMPPFHIKAKESQRTANGSFVLRNAKITTCDGDRPEFYMKAREVRITKNNRFRAKGVVFYLGPVPILYMPYVLKGLGEERTDIDLVPGYSSRLGAYLLTAYNYRINGGMTAATRLDYYGSRGPAVGQDFNWGDPRLTYRGGFKAYYVNDGSPMKGRTDDEVDEFGDLVTSDRYRLKLFDTRSLSDRDYMMTDLNYLSDPVVVEDFFDNEYRNNVQPENRVSLGHRGDQYTAGLQINKRLNDFYDNVDRLPEATLDVPRMKLGETPLYYESGNSASFLSRLYPDGSDDEDYDAFRLDSSHMLYYPTKQFGFLSLIPRGGLRGTFYSYTYEDATVTNVISEVDTNGITHVTNRVETVRNDLGSDLRVLGELGFETSFKSFKVLTEEWMGRDDQGLRHIVEPYALYTFVPEPNITPENLPQFDEVDTLDKRNDVRFGVRNKLQTKRRTRVHDLVDADVWTTYRLDPDEDQHDFTDIYFDTELRLVDWFMVDFDGSYDEYENNISTFNTQLGLIFPDESRLSVEYRYADSTRDQIAAELRLFPNLRWSLDTYGRYAIDRSEFEEKSCFVTHKTSCVGWGLGFKQIDSDVQVWLQFWLLAFPKSSVNIGR